MPSRGACRAAVTFCSWHSVIAMVARGPVRGPSHLCKWCNQRYRRHDSVVSVQLALLVHGTVLLMIRQSWVRAPPAPPNLSCGDVPLSTPCDRAAGPLSGPDGRRMMSRRCFAGCRYSYSLKGSPWTRLSRYVRAGCPNRWPWWCHGWWTSPWLLWRRAATGPVSGCLRSSGSNAAGCLASSGELACYQRQHARPAA
jgi:hypothetical protein